MFNKCILYSTVGALGYKMFFLLVIGALSFVSPMVFTQAATDGFNQGTSDQIPATGELDDYQIYLPLVMKNYPVIPGTPSLSAISNPDGDGNYTVSWSSSVGANTYTLEEDANADFSNPTTVYSGASTSAAISGRDIGTYFYRVLTSNSYASSGWSNVESVIVTVPLPDCPQTGPWRGVTSQEKGFNFIVEDSPQCQVAAKSLVIVFRDSCGSDINMTIMTSAQISNNHFEVAGENISVVGDFSNPTTANGTFSYSKDACTASGTWTAAFNPGADGTVTTLAVQADGKILVGGNFNFLRGERRDSIGRLNTDGTLDETFTAPGINGTVNALAVQADGKIVVGGRFTQVGSVTRNYIARLNPDGTLDTSFNPGVSGSAAYVSVLAIQPDGKILVGGYFETLGGVLRSNIGRLNPDGSVDLSFDCDTSVPNTLALQADGKILLGKSAGFNSSSATIWRYNSDGSIDLSFIGTVTGAYMETDVYTLLLQPDGKVVAGGYFTKMEGVTRSNIGRLDSGGNLDTTFDPGAGYIVNILALQADNKILVGGQFSSLGGEVRARIGRLNADGTLDADFNPGANGTVYALVVQADGKIVVGGSFTTLGGETHNFIGRLNADGTPDATFP